MPSFHLTLDGKTHAVELAGSSATIDGELLSIEVESGEQRATVRVGGRPWQVEILEATPSHLTIRVGGVDHIVDLEGRTWRAPPAAVAPPPAAAASGGAVLAPMAGRILRLAVRSGDAVQAGDLLLVLEAMKMENEIRATRSGRIARIAVESGERVSGGAELLSIE